MQKDFRICGVVCWAIFIAMPFFLPGIATNFDLATSVIATCGFVVATSFVYMCARHNWIAPGFPLPDPKM
mgnify:CR=1 FL=1